MKLDAARDRGMAGEGSVEGPHMKPFIFSSTGKGEGGKDACRYLDRAHSHIISTNTALAMPILA